MDSSTALEQWFVAWVRAGDTSTPESQVGLGCVPLCEPVLANAPVQVQGPLPPQTLSDWEDCWAATMVSPHGINPDRQDASGTREQHDEPGQGRVHVEPELDPTVAELREVGRDRSILDAAMLRSVRSIVDATRDHVLDRRDWIGLELNRTQTRAVRADVKRAAIGEVQHSLGFTVTEATSLVGLAMTGSNVVDLTVDALRRGEVTWAQVRRFWESAAAPSRDLSAEQRELVAQALFGTTESLAAVERFDEDGMLQLRTPWDHTAFDAALEREVTACEGADVESERARRQRAHQSRKARVRVHDDGTATLIVRGPAVSIVGIHDRYDSIARNLRGQGHENPLHHLVVDSMLAVLGFGHLDLPDPGTLAELCATDLDDLIAVVNGAPRITLQVIVPLDALAYGHPNFPEFDGSNTSAACHDAAASPTQQPDPAEGQPDPAQEGAGPAQEDAECSEGQAEDEIDPDPEVADGRPFNQEHGPPPDWARAPGPPPPAPPPLGPPPGPPPPAPPPAAQPSIPAGSVGHDPRLRHGRGLVAEVLGTYPLFITPGHVRELFFSPGTTLHRLVTHSRDGRLVERTIATYRPDADMRRQVKAADVYSRAPFSRLSGRSLEIDHVIPYGTEPGGVTGELNLADLDKRNHKIKTIGDLRLAINERRDLTFTTLLGQVTGSRVHDYNQYLRAAHPDDMDERRDLANRALYALLATDPRFAHNPTKDAWLDIDHTHPTTGQRHPGPPPHPEDAHELLGVMGEEQAEDQASDQQTD